MKKSFLLLIFLMFFYLFQVDAQTQKGNQLVGGDFGIGFGRQSTTFTSYTSSYQNSSYGSRSDFFLIGPVYSFFIAQNLDLGASIGYNKQTTTYDSVNNAAITNVPPNTKQNIFYATVYLRKYLLYKQKFGIRTGPYAQYQKSKFNYFYQNNPTLFNSSQNGTNFNAGLMLDLVYFPIRRLGLISNIGSLGYTHQHIEQNNSLYSDNSKGNSVGLNFASNLNLSIVYCIGK